TCLGYRHAQCRLVGRCSYCYPLGVCHRPAVQLAGRFRGYGIAGIDLGVFLAPAIPPSAKPSAHLRSGARVDLGWTATPGRSPRENEYLAPAAHAASMGMPLCTHLHRPRYLLPYLLDTQIPTGTAGPHA